MPNRLGHPGALKFLSFKWIVTSDLGEGVDTILKSILDVFLSEGKGKTKEI